MSARLPGQSVFLGTREDAMMQLLLLSASNQKPATPELCMS
jgi:hypothetical protein